MAPLPPPDYAYAVNPFVMVHPTAHAYFGEPKGAPCTPVEARCIR